jgi:hypothetical protein
MLRLLDTGDAVGHAACAIPRVAATSRAGASFAVLAMGGQGSIAGGQVPHRCRAIDEGSRWAEGRGLLRGTPELLE